MTWKIKTDGESNSPVFDEQGRPVYIDPEGKELPLDPPAMYQKINRLGAENQKHRSNLEEANQKLQLFKDIDDIAAWREEATKALETVANFNDKDWMKAEKVEKLKKDMADAYEKKLGDKEKSIQLIRDENGQVVNKLQGQIRRLLVSNKFAVSKYFSGGGDSSITILPSNIAEDHFGKYFEVEENDNGMPTIKAIYANGDPVISKVNPGEPADFEEAIGLIIDQYPGKESILRSTSAKGSGSAGGGSHLKGEEGSLQELKQQYEKAQEAKDYKKMITLKHRIFDLEKGLKK
jgi:Txe/YoeB family toxin of Txe-Axe toxin-antitoxin module